MYDRCSAISGTDTGGVGVSEVLTHAADTNGYYALAIWSNNSRHSDYFIRVPGPTSVSGVEDPPLRASSTLVQNRPNPFAPGTAIKCAIAVRGRVVLSVHDVTGRKVKTLVDREMEQQYYTAYWDGRDRNGNRVAPGIYLCVLEAAGRRETMKIVLAE